MPSKSRIPGPTATAVTKPQRPTRSSTASASTTRPEALRRLLEENREFEKQEALEQQKALELQRALEEQQDRNKLRLKNILNAMASLMSDVVRQNKPFIRHWFLQRPESSRPRPNDMEPKDFIELFLHCGTHLKDDTGSRVNRDSLKFQFRQFRTALHEVLDKPSSRTYIMPKYKDHVPDMKWDEACYDEYRRRLEGTHRHLGLAGQ